MLRKDISKRINSAKKKEKYTTKISRNNTNRAFLIQRLLNFLPDAFLSVFLFCFSPSSLPITTPIFCMLRPRRWSFCFLLCISPHSSSDAHRATISFGMFLLMASAFLDDLEAYRYLYDLIEHSKLQVCQAFMPIDLSDRSFLPF